MKAGGGYLPLDPSLPPERLARICAQVRPAAVITDRADALGRARDRGCSRSASSPRISRTGPRRPRQASPHPDNLCYAIYTSGSTGDPKAVAVSHGSLACVIGELAREYQITDRGPGGAVRRPSAFDTSLEQIFVTLTSGATLHAAAAGHHGALRPAALASSASRSPSST